MGTSNRTMCLAGLEDFFDFPAYLMGCFGDGGDHFVGWIWLDAWLI